MVQPIYTHDIARYRDYIRQQGVQGAIKMYADLQDKGHGYAGWAKGVAEASGLNTGGLGGTITGRAAVLFMKSTSGREFSQAELNSIRVGMAEGYLAVLEKNVERGGGQTRTEVRYDQARDFHRKVFEDHKLSINNWTLETPMKLIGRYEGGPAAQEAQWQRLMKTKGDYVDALFASNGLYGKVADYADGYISRSSRTGRVVTSYEMSDYAVYTNHKIDEADRKAARHWVNHVDLIKPIVYSRSEEMRHGYGDAQYAQTRSPYTDDMPRNAPLTSYAQAAMDNGRACFTKFCDYYNIDYPKDKLDNIASAIAAHARAENMRDVSKIDVDGDSVLIGHYQPDLVTAEFSLQKAVNTPVQESIQQVQAAENRLLQEERERELAREMERSRGISMS